MDKQISLSLLLKYNLYFSLIIIIAIKLIVLLILLYNLTSYYNLDKISLLFKIILPYSPMPSVSTF